MAVPSAVEQIEMPPQVAESQSKVIKAGNLTKEGAFVKNWKLSYFELTSFQMTYYNDDVRRIPK